MNGLSGELLPFLHYFKHDNREFAELDTKLLDTFKAIIRQLVAENRGKVNKKLMMSLNQRYFEKIF